MKNLKKMIPVLPLFIILFAACGGGTDTETEAGTARPDVTVSVSDGIANVSWNAVEGAVGYEIQHAAAQNMANAVSEQADGTSFGINGLDTSGIYYVRVRARFSGGWGEWSDIRTITFFAISVVFESYNILGEQHVDKSPWPNRKEAMGAIVLQESNFPDVIGIQECASTSQMNDVIDMLKEKYNYISGNNTYMSPRLIFWKKDRFELVDTSVVDMTPGKYPSTYRGSRYALYVHLRCRSTGCEFLMYNIHLRSGGDVETAALRKEMIDFLAPHAKEKSAELGDLPVVILGDMNSRVQTVLGGILSSPKVFAGYGFQDTYDLTTDRTNQNYSTYNTQENVDDCTVTYSAAGAGRIDYIVVWPAERFIVDDYEIVLNFTNESARKVECPIPSDHNPVRATVRMSY